MLILDIVLMIFIILETMNIAIIYFFPEFKYGNGVAVFKFISKSKDDQAASLFAKYMANWVAGSKLIFIALLLVIFFTGSELTKLLSVIVLVPCIATFYIKLNPIMRKLDAMGQLNPKGYSKTLLFMITGFISMFLVALALYFIF